LLDAQRNTIRERTGGEGLVNFDRTQEFKV